MTHSQWRLLFRRDFLGLWATQVLGALNDNIFKSSILIYLTYTALDTIQIKPDALSAIAAGLLILPFFLFSGTAGEIADKYEKSLLVRRLKTLEIIIVCFAAFAFYEHAVWSLFFLLFMMGTQSAFFGPIKYSAIPEIINKGCFIAANGLISAGTFMGILIGAVIGSLLIMKEDGLLIVSIIMIVTALAGRLFSQLIPELSPGDPLLKVDKNIISSTWSTFSFAYGKPSIFALLGFISWFWFVGATILSQLPNFSKSIINGDENCVTFFLCLFTVGIGIGSLLCNSLLRSKISLRLTPWASLGLTIVLIDWSFSALKFTSLVLPAQLLNLETFLSLEYSWRLSADLFLISILGGIYIVPFYALIQSIIDKAHRARIIGCLNIVVSFWMALSSVALVILFNANFTIIEILVGLGIISSIISLLLSFYVRKTRHKHTISKRQT